MRGFIFGGLFCNNGNNTPFGSLKKFQGFKYVSQEEDKEATKELTHKIQEQEGKIREELEKIQLKEDVVQKLIDIFETYQTLSNDRNEYFNKKYYMAGFDYGERIVLRNVNK